MMKTKEEAMMQLWETRQHPELDDISPEEILGRYMTEQLSPIKPKESPHN